MTTLATSTRCGPLDGHLNYCEPRATDYKYNMGVRTPDYIKFPQTMDRLLDLFGMTPTYFHLLIESKVLPSPIERHGEAVWHYLNVSAAIRDLETVYFADVRTHGLIKIGYTANLFNRIDRLRYDLNSPVDLMMTIPGNVTMEACIHDRFDHLRDGGLDGGAFECFWPGLDLLDYMEAL